MARVDIPLPGKDKDYDSRKSRAQLINLMVQTNQDGSFRSIIKREGTVTVNTTTQSDNIISNLYIGSDLSTYFVGRTNFYRIVLGGVLVDLGAHGFTTTDLDLYRVISNNKAPDPQYLFNFGANGAIFDTTITAITDTDFTGKTPSGGAMLFGRFYFADRAVDTEFFASALLDGFTYDPLAIADADEEAGDLVDVRSYKSALLLFKTRNIEYWQTFDDATFPLRRVLGASIKQGIGLATPVDQLYDYIGFAGSDSKAYLMTGLNIQQISDIDYAQKVQDPTDTIFLPDVSFIDGPDHRYFVVTSASSLANTVEFTWVYDLKTGQSHYRTSSGSDIWPFMFGSWNDTALSQDVLIRSHRDAPSPDIFALRPDIFTDDGTDFECLLQSASLSFGQDATIDYIEMEMETGVGNGDSADPEMTVKYSKDGGVNFTTWGTVKLGGSTDKSNRIRMNNFGRLVRHTDFVLQLTIEEPVRVEIYGAYAEINGGF